MENVTVDGVYFEAPKRKGTAVFDFSIMREDDFLHNVSLKNAVLKNVGRIADVDESLTDCGITAENVTLKY